MKQTLHKVKLRTRGTEGSSKGAGTALLYERGSPSCKATIMAGRRAKAEDGQETPRKAGVRSKKNWTGESHILI